MEESSPVSLAAHFSDLDDPRDDNKRHKLLDIVLIAVCAVVCGADNWEDVELFGLAKYSWLKTFLELPHGIPSHDTFRRVFALLDAEQFQTRFGEWIEAVERLTVGQVVAVDGKTLRRSHDRANGQEAIAMVSAWASTNGVVLGQLKVDDKSNEIPAIPQLLDRLAIAGCIVTIDAIGCQTKIVQKIIEKQADYVLPVKENQGRLYDTLEQLFEDPAESRWVSFDHHQTVEKGHNRLETRQCWATCDQDYVQYIGSLAAWQGVRSIAMVEAERCSGQERTVKRRYFISSLEGNAEQLLYAIRGHWGIENQLHWVLDIAFREDECRLRTGNGAQNFAVLRHIALNLLRGEQTLVASIHGKRLRAGWDQDYLLRVLKS